MDDDRRVIEVTAAVNVYLRAMIEGDPEEMDRAAREWERVAGEEK